MGDVPKGYQRDSGGKHPHTTLHYTIKVSSDSRLERKPVAAVPLSMGIRLNPHPASRKANIGIC
jgi:hypothetical protein